jgi:hypothetical protein
MAFAAIAMNKHGPPTALRLKKSQEQMGLVSN